MYLNLFNNLSFLDIDKTTKNENLFHYIIMKIKQLFYFLKNLFSLIINLQNLEQCLFYIYIYIYIYIY